MPLKTEVAVDAAAQGNRQWISTSKLATKVYKAGRAYIFNNRRAFVISAHVIQAALANYLAFVLRFNFILRLEYLRQMLSYFPILLAIRLASYLSFGLYKDVWRYSSVDDLMKIVKASAIGSLIFFGAVRYFYGDKGYPLSIYFIDYMLLVMISGGGRLFIRVFNEYAQRENSGKRVLIFGAGDAGEMIVRDMKNNPEYAYEPIGFIDDDPYKKGLSIHGVPILGPRSALEKIARKHGPEELLVCMQSADGTVLNDIYERCNPLNIPIKTLPPIADVINGRVTASQIKPLSLEALLQRAPVRADIKPVRNYIAGKTVLVTGAGGSIGSELSRQILEYGPSNLIIFDRYENSLFKTDMNLRELMKKNMGINTGWAGRITTVIGDLLDHAALDLLFSSHRPQIVFHAAAHKHVPLMEHNPMEAVKNNIFGTKNILDFSNAYKIEKFVMISTDKAVNPTSIMGATKRVAEMLTINMDRSSSSHFSVVRFGNVLGSNGSVVPIFKEQLKRGGPLTVTHPEIKRYFMLIPEAVSLVLLAAASGSGGNIYVLDMGEQVHISRLAENMIRLSGFVPYKDIGIEFTGLRPGEKLFEELFDESEQLMPTSHKKLRIAAPAGISSPEELSRHLAALEKIVVSGSKDMLIDELRTVVPTFRRAGICDAANT
ncbi:MAG: nucleoside-diphosphate sugar epimerase/dehydratase [Nitrospiraceae bacterium]|nr:nucleoside-diphosphate sugar epimerase/dehydratase [Nitrospiraceae bacterium]